MINYGSPATYSTRDCYKGIVLDVTNFGVGGSPATGSGGGGGQPRGGAGGVRGGEIDLAWDATWPTTEADCTTANVTAMIFSRRGDVWEFEQEKQACGRWSGFCFTPRLILGPEHLQLGGTYRLAITARTADTTAAPTRAFAAVSRRWAG